MSGSLDRGALRLALGDVAARHESLRTVFAEDADGPHQVVLPSTTAPELTLVPLDRPDEDELRRALQHATRTAFDLVSQVPWRVWLFELGGDECVLLVVVHHIA
ncbi:condensation domain-containing protein, partial [Streptomyces sp. HSW2009]|uniref:condensation domain-containing protein n=1 Tax=Streptomyces sp. HSW2009 TaxID=3142890 RepID=UPI0032F05B41